MSDFTSHRRFYLSKRITARIVGEFALSALWQSKQESYPGGTELPVDFPCRAELALAGYVATEDLNGADEEELWDWVGLAPADSEAVFAALADL